MSKRSGLIALVLAALLCVAPAAHAAMEQDTRDQPSAPGAALGAAAVNIVYFPLRFVVSLVGVELSGTTGWLTGGNVGAAHDVWGVFRGPAYVSPAVIEGQEPLPLGPWQVGGH
jgi:hypothetical protein